MNNSYKNIRQSPG